MLGGYRVKFPGSVLIVLGGLLLHTGAEDAPAVSTAAAEMNCLRLRGGKAETIESGPPLQPGHCQLQLTLQRWGRQGAAPNGKVVHK